MGDKNCKVAGRATIRRKRRSYQTTTEIQQLDTIHKTPTEANIENFVYGYGSSNGPMVWEVYFPHCSGDRQSPIPLDTKTAILSKGEPILNWYNWSEMPVSMTLQNVDYTAKLSAYWESLDDTPSVFFSGSDRVYVFGYLNFRWGINDYIGSEHTIDQKRYPLEMQVVMFRKELKTVEEALKSLQRDAIRIISYLFKVRYKNIPLDEIVTCRLSSIRKTGSRLKIPPIPLERLVPAFSHYYFIYRGSLTTPPCLENTIFIVRKEPQVIDKTQIH